MIASRTDAARRAEVRHAARGWHAAGAIDGATLARIEAAYPDDGHRMALAWKALVFVIVTIAANALFFGIAAFLHDDSRAAPFLVFAVVLAGVTERLLHGSRVGDNGSAAATSFWAAAYATLAIGIEASRGSHDWPTTSLLAAAAAFAAAGWRWGYAAECAIGALSFFAFLARFGTGRLSWILFGLALAAATWSLRTRRWLPPPMREAASAIFVIGMSAVYGGLNRYSVDHGSIESMARGGAVVPAPTGAIVPISTLATAVLPLALLAWGLYGRRILALDLGLVFAALSLATLRFYVHIAPLWAILTVSGILLVLGALEIGRRLRRAPDGEWRGFTARPLHSGRSSGIETVAIVAAFAPDGRAPAPAERGGMTPGGGGYGGGGATGSF